MTHIRVLGDHFQIRLGDGSRRVELARGQVRQLLSVLAIETDKVVSPTRLTELMWESGDFRDLARSLKQVVYNARRSLPADLLITDTDGYRLRCGPGDHLDLTEFRNLTDLARTGRESNPASAATAYRDALDLWGDVPLRDLPDTSGMAPIRGRLLAERRNVREEFLEVKLSMSQHREMISPGRTWLSEDPFNEHLRGLLMLALDGSNRKGEALQLYEEVGALLGPNVDPGQWLQRLAQQIVRNDSQPRWRPRPIWLASSARQSTGTGFNVDIPNAARMYDFMLGGKNNFAADREAIREIVKGYPRAPETAQQNRAFLERAVQHLAKRVGIRQFLDIGAGLPTMNNVHEIAQRFQRDAHVVYVDNDPVVCTHGRALMANTTSVDLIAADLRSPSEILAHPSTRRLINFTEPFAILLVGVLHFVPDEDDPYAAVATLRDALPPGGYLVVTHVTAPPTVSLESLRNSSRVFNQANVSVHYRDRREINLFFGDLPLVEPGLVNAPEWHQPTPAGWSEELLRIWLAGMARKS